MPLMETLHRNSIFFFLVDSSLTYTPSLYDLVLAFSSSSGLSAWNEDFKIFSLDLCNIMQENPKSLSTRHHFSCRWFRYDIVIVYFAPLVHIFSPNTVIRHLGSPPSQDLEFSFFLKLILGNTLS